MKAPPGWSIKRASSKPSPQATCLSVRSPIVDQKPGAASHTACSPAAVRPATSPWLSASPQCSTGRRRPAAALRASATSPAANTPSALVRRCSSQTIRPSSISSPAASASSLRGPDAAADQDEVGVHRRAAGDADGAGIERFDGGAELQRDAVLGQPARDPPARLLAEPLHLGDRLVGDQRHPQAAHGQRDRGFAADEARAHDGGRARALGALAQRARRLERAQEQHVGMIGAGHGEGDGLRAGGEHERVIGERLAALERHRPRLRVERGGLGPVPEVDLVLGVPGGLLDRDLVRLGLAAQELLGQRGARVGRVLLGREHRHRAVAAGVAVAARGGQARRAAADDHESLGRGHAGRSKRSRA